MKILDLLEAFNTEQDLKWVKDTQSKYYTEFDIGTESYFIEVHLFEVNDKKVSNIIFGKFDSSGAGTTKATPSKKPIRVFSVVINGVKKLLGQLGVDAAVYVAKDGDGAFEGRASLYKTLGTHLAKSTGWNLYVRDGRDISATIISKLPLSKTDIQYIKDNIRSTNFLKKKK